MKFRIDIFLLVTFNDEYFVGQLFDMLKVLDFIKIINGIMIKNESSHYVNQVLNKLNDL
jgi:hypothetical protein